MKKFLYTLSLLAIGLLLNLQFAKAQATPEVTVIQPSETGIEWVIDNTYLISWTDNFSLPVDIYLINYDYAPGDAEFETLIEDDVEGSTFAWHVDGGIFNAGTNYKVEVRSSVVAYYKDDSEHTFALVANATGSSMMVEQPSLPNIDWVIGQSYLISWIDNIPGNVNIELWDATKTAKVADIATNVEGSTYLWNTTGYTIGTYWVKVTSLDQAIADFGDHSFDLVVSLAGDIELLQPIANNTQISVGSTYLISWIDTFTEAVKIELTDGAGAVIDVIKADAEGSTFYWNTATTPAGNLISGGSYYKIKVSSVNNPAITDISQFAFEAVANTGTTISLQQPNIAGIQWLKGGQYLISWVDDFSDNVTIELWDEFGAAGVKVADIASNVPGSTYIWNTAVNPVTLDPGEYTIKVSNSTGYIVDYSDNSFEIISNTGFIEVLQPNIAGINWVIGTTNLISWIDEVPGPVDIELESSVPFNVAYDKADNYGGIWADGDNEGYGFGPWDLRVVSDNGGILEFFVGDPSLGSLPGMDNPSFGMIARSAPADISNSIEAYREFSAPLELENTFSFDYGMYGGSGAKGFVLYAGGESGDELLEVSIINSTAVTITHNAVTTTMFNNIGGDHMHFTFEYLVSGDLRVQANSRDGFEPDFDQTYTINAAPDAIKFFAAGQFDDVNYLARAGYINNLKIQTYIADIATDVSGSTYLWNTTGFGAGTYKIRIKSGDIEDLSDNTFNLVSSAGGTLTFFQPQAGDQWSTNGAYWISWEDTFSEPLDIYLRRGANGSLYNVQLKNDFEGSAFDYAVNAPAADDYYIYIKSSTNGSYNFSSGLFDIVETVGGTVEVLQPVGGETWIKGNAYFISWNDELAEPVDVFLKNDALAYSLQLKDDFEGTTFDYALPGTLADHANYYIRVQSSIDGATYFDNSGLFTITSTVGGFIEVLQPVGGEVWVRGNAYFIAWNDELVEPVDVYLGNGNGYYQLIANDFEGTAFDYTLPAGLELRNDYFIRVESSIDGTTWFDVSGNFEVVAALSGTITVNQPNGGEHWNTNSAYLISWIDDIAENVVIDLVEYDNMNVEQSVTRISPVGGLPGSTWIWTIPNNPALAGVYYKIRISSSNTASTTSPDESDGYFTIQQPVMANVYPNPAMEFVTVRFDEHVDGKFDAILYDRFNNVMLNTNFDASTKVHRISTAFLPEGVYFLRMTSGKQIISEKIIVQH